MRSLFLCLSLAAALPALAADMEESWTFIDETAAAESPQGKQARAAIYRGDLLVALRCHDDGSRRWESFLVGATWFLQPKAHVTFELTVDAGPPMVLEFQRETNFRFALINPPRQLIEALSTGSELTIGGSDFDGGARAVPLKGSKDAIDGAFALCGYDPLAS